MLIWSPRPQVCDRPRKHLRSFSSPPWTLCWGRRCRKQSPWSSTRPWPGSPMSRADKRLPRSLRSQASSDWRMPRCASRTRRSGSRCGRAARCCRQPRCSPRTSPARPWEPWGCPRPARRLRCRSGCSSSLLPPLSARWSEGQRLTVCLQLSRVRCFEFQIMLKSTLTAFASCLLRTWTDPFLLLHKVCHLLKKKKTWKNINDEADANVWNLSAEQFHVGNSSVMASQGRSHVRPTGRRLLFSVYKQSLRLVSFLFLLVFPFSVSFLCVLFPLVALAFLWIPFFRILSVSAIAPLSFSPLFCLHLFSIPLLHILPLLVLIFLQTLLCLPPPPLLLLLHLLPAPPRMRRRRANWSKRRRTLFQPPLFALLISTWEGCVQWEAGRSVPSKGLS